MGWTTSLFTPTYLTATLYLGYYLFITLRLLVSTSIPADDDWLLGIGANLEEALKGPSCLLQDLQSGTMYQDSSPSETFWTCAPTKSSLHPQAAQQGGSLVLKLSFQYSSHEEAHVGFLKRLVPFTFLSIIIFFLTLNFTISVPCMQESHLQ